MTFGEIIAVSVIGLIIGGAIFYIIKSKKSGKKCIGCPNSEMCKFKNHCSCQKGDKLDSNTD